jgi:hypothetical protein
MKKLFNFIKSKEIIEGILKWFITNYEFLFFIIIGFYFNFAFLVGLMYFFYWGLEHFLLWAMGLGIIWFIIIITFLATIIAIYWRFIKGFSSLFADISAKLTPRGRIHIFMVGMAFLFGCAYLINIIWDLKKTYSSDETFVAFLATLFVIELTAVLIHGTIECWSDHYDKYYLN